MSEKLVLQDNEGKVIRSFQGEGDRAVLVRREDTRRIQLVESVDVFEERKIPFETLQEVDLKELKKKPLLVGQLGQLTFTQEVETTYQNVENREESSRDWWVSLLFVFIIGLGSIGYLYNAPPEVVEEEEEEEQQIVKIVKPEKPKVVRSRQTFSNFRKSNVKTKVKKSVKRMGALAVLGQMNKGKQKGGINLGAAKTSKGPGLGGGTAGSGGVQTTLYGKGLVAQPLGAGQNIKGAGGYGTKGKGGGQAGYGTLSLVGSSGTSDINVGRESLRQGGMDLDLIRAVFQKNQGQITYCYEQGLQTDPSLRGRVFLKFNVSANGRAVTASVAGSTIKSATVENCILRRLKAWKFPLPEGGKAVGPFTYPVALRKVGGRG